MTFAPAFSAAYTKPSTSFLYQVSGPGVTYP